jgi:hypothetical protein
METYIVEKTVHQLDVVDDLNLRVSVGSSHLALVSALSFQ